ncbi:MAG: LysM peptidoglycan-binding domain-containing protein [Myxococcales bacterium]|nr:LysM peptidoglycan-binding domain-containing protein [Myxococcales bacterium]
MSIWSSTALSTTLAAALAAAPKVETIEYTIQKGDSCASIAQKVYGDHEQYELIHQYNRWLGAQLPHHLEPGQTLVLPKTVPPALPDAELTAARHRVEARSPDTSDWSRAAPGLDLWRGWRVNTHEGSSAEITFRDESRIEMRESTLVIIYGGSSTKARRQTGQAQLDRGALRSRLGAYTGKDDRIVTVTTPSAVAEFAGGQGLVTVDDAGTSRVANHGAGKAAVRSADKKGGQVQVKPKMGSRVDKGKAPTKPKPLPPTPAWIDRGPTTFVAAGERGGTISGEWGAIAGAKSYRVEIARQADGRESIHNQVVPATIQRFEAQALPAGDYYVGIAAIDADAFESAPSERRKLSVVAVPLRTPGEAPLPEAPTDAGEAEPGPARVLRGTRLEVPSGLRCRVGEGEPSRAPVLDTAGEHAISCVDAEDRPVPGFTVAVYDVRVAAAAEATAAVRGQSTTTAFSIDAEVPLPRRLWIDAPEGLLAGAPQPTATPGQWAVRVHADEGAPAEATLRIMADAGGEAVELGHLAVHVDEPPSAPSTTEPAASPRGPERHMIEGGIYGGLMFPSDKHGLIQERIGTGRSDLAYYRLNPVAGSLGLRLGYYPIRWVGLEIENGLGPTRVRDQGDPATLFAIRGHVLGQLPWRITPTVHVGGGVLGVAALSVLGREFDASFHFGAGAKFYATRWLAVRLDLRDVVAEAKGPGLAHMPELVVGLSGVIGRRSTGSKR